MKASVRHVSCEASTPTVPASGCVLAGGLPAGGVASGSFPPSSLRRDGGGLRRRPASRRSRCRPTTRDHRRHRPDTARSRPPPRSPTRLPGAPARHTVDSATGFPGPRRRSHTDHRRRTVVRAHRISVVGDQNGSGSAARFPTAPARPVGSAGLTPASARRDSGFGDGIIVIYIPETYEIHTKISQ